MPRKRYSTEQIITKPRQAEVKLRRGLRPHRSARSAASASRRMTGGAKSTVCASIKHARARERAAEAAGGGSGAGQRDLEGGGLGNVLSPPRRRQAVDYVRHHLSISERRACRVLGQSRSTHRHRPRVPDGECRVVARLIELATQSGRYGYRRITARLRGEGWRVHHKRVARLWRREGLNVPQKQPTRGRLWLTDGSCIRRRPESRHPCGRTTVWQSGHTMAGP